MTIDQDRLSQVIEKAALENAIKFKGKANPKALIGAVFKEFPNAKSDMKTIMAVINSIVDKVNTLSFEEQEKKLLELDPDFFEKQKEQKKQRQEERKGLPPLKNAKEGQVVTRMPPEPSKYNHLGHAMSFLINYLYAEMYKGKCVLRFDDTNPEKEEQEYVDAMEQDVVSYLGITPSAVIFASDYMPKFYDAAADLIKQELAYTCTCPSEKMRDERRNMVECDCRSKSAYDISKEWMEMIEGDQPEGTMVLRLKIDMQHKNAVMRDPVIMRICHKPHYRQGDEYKVWPMYDFETALMDSWVGTTHILRSNEFDTRIELHNHIKDLFELSKQECVHYGRYNVLGLTTKGREIREKIESGEMIGWDDPRLLTLRALHRRGIVKEAFFELAQQVGLSKQQTNLDFGVIAAVNRQILDKEASRYFFVEDPVKIKVKDWPQDLSSVELKLHPHHNRGGRPLKLDGEFYVSKKDWNNIQDGKVFRLIDTINLQYDSTKEECVVHSMGMDDFKEVPREQKHGLIHFLPANEQLVKAKLLTPEAKYVEGLCEPNVKQLGEGSHIQFERVCFARLDEKADSGEYIFWYSHE